MTLPNDPDADLPFAMFHAEGRCPECGAILPTPVHDPQPFEVVDGILHDGEGKPVKAVVKEPLVHLKDPKDADPKPAEHKAAV